MTTKTTSRLVAGGFLLSAALAGCVSKNKYETVTAENQQLRQQLATETAQAQSEEARVGRLQGALKISLESDLLFAPGSWELSEQGRQTIAKIVPRLAPQQQQKLVVIGYTDNQPIGPGLEKKGISSNKELSLRRAEAVRQFLISQGVNPTMITAVGRADSNPVASNETPRGRAQNRRVELSLGG